MSLDLGLSVATGRQWLGKPVEKGLVVYIAAEGVGGLAKRVAAWKLVNGIDQETGCPLGWSVR